MSGDFIFLYLEASILVGCGMQLFWFIAPDSSHWKNVVGDLE